MKTLSLVAGTALLLAPLQAFSAKPIYTADGLALTGYDAVAYFTEGKAVKGMKEFTTEWSGARWRFASAANRDAFTATPVKYAPQYGGYCAWAVSKDYTYSADPDAWRIVGGKLYLNYSKDVQRMWQEELPQVIDRADKNWPAVLEKPAK